jgi:sugar O-acyltransferase (sialic acid O-acetyltransferase NeuD family)
MKIKIVNNIVLIGGGGHAKSCIDVIETEGKWKIAGLVDKFQSNKRISGYEILGNDNDLDKIVKEYKYFHIAIGQIKTPQMRINIYEKIKRLGGHFPIIVSPNAHVSKNSTIGEGTIIMHNASVNNNVMIGKNCIINTGAIIEHDVELGDFVHASTGCVINGNTKIGNKSFVGSNATIYNSIKKQKIIIPAGSIIKE